MDNIKTRKILDGITSIPTLPNVINEILHQLDSPKSNAKTIEEIMHGDPAITLKTLKLVNSAYYGMNNKVATLKDAIVMLGFNNIKELIVLSSMQELFFKANYFKGGTLWVHSFAVATAAKILADYKNIPNKDLVFTAGLLHDVAKIFEDQIFYDDFKKAIDISKNQGKDLLEAENEIMGINHCIIGKKITSNWKLPESIISTIFYHHTPDLSDKTEYKDIIYAVHIADLLVRFKKLGDSGNSGKVHLSRRTLEKFGIKQDELKIILKKLDLELEEKKSFLTLLA
jgi:putative nucleotidyltransferase with HDIG domain